MRKILLSALLLATILAQGLEVPGQELVHAQRSVPELLEALREVRLCAAEAEALLRSGAALSTWLEAHPRRWARARPERQLEQLLELEFFATAEAGLSAEAFVAVLLKMRWAGRLQDGPHAEIYRPRAEDFERLLAQLCLCLTGAAQEEEEAAAVVSFLRTCVSGQAMFRSADLEDDDAYDYAHSLLELGQYGLIDPRFTDGEHGEYTFELVRESPEAWWLRADPGSEPGLPSFFVDASGVIRVAESGLAGVDSPPMRE